MRRKVQTSPGETHPLDAIDDVQHAAAFDHRDLLVHVRVHGVTTRGWIVSRQIISFSPTTI